MARETFSLLFRQQWNQNLRRVAAGTVDGRQELTPRQKTISQRALYQPRKLPNA